MSTFDFFLFEMNWRNNLKTLISKPLPNECESNAVLGFGNKSYVPILKTKRGEMWALENLKPASKQHVIPLFEIHCHKSDCVDDHAASVCASIASHWGSRYCFVDTKLYGTSGSLSVEAAKKIFSAAKIAKLATVPVTGLGRSIPYQIEIKNAIENANRGVMIRVLGSDCNSLLHNRINALLTTLGVTAKDVDLLLDFGTQDDEDDLVSLIQQSLFLVPNPLSWRSLTVASGSFPGSLKGFQAHSWHTLARPEWLAWSKTSGPSKLVQRIPTFSDYGTRDTGAPVEFGSPSANIRYTAGQAFLVHRGDVAFKDGGAAQIFTICKSLTKRTEFRGPLYSKGDSHILITATAQGSSGNPESWIKWCMNHHFETVVDGILSRP